MLNTAKRVIIPKTGVFRTIFLYTGQGDVTLHVIPDGLEHKYVLVDCDHDHDPNEVNLVAMFRDLFEGTDRQIDVFINTHPHNDHIGGIRELYEEIGISEIWHSNHRPGREHKSKFEDLHHVIKQIGKELEFHLKGTNQENTVRDVDGNRTERRLGDVTYQVLSPAEHLCDEIDEGTANTRDRMIHTRCGVIRFTYGQKPQTILMTGDSDVATWEETIMYHENVLKSLVLHASHHGSDTFFREGEDADPYFGHIEAIKPDYVVVSAPRKEDSKYGHPDDFAMEQYRRFSKGVFHLGERPYSLIVDIYPSGDYAFNEDTELINAYSDPEDDDNREKEKPKQENRHFTERKEESKPRPGEKFA